MTKQRLTLEAHRRTAMTKGEKNAIRSRGDVPGIVYGKDMEPTPIYITGESFKQLNKVGKVLVSVNINGQGEVAAMVNDIDRDMMNKKPLHIDLHAVNLREVITVDVPIILDGLEPVEKQGAVIQQQAREVRVHCLPTDAPDLILHNIADLKIYDNVAMADLKLPAGVTLAQDPTEIVCAIIPARNDAPETEIEPKEPELVHDTEGTGKDAKQANV